MVTEPLSSMTNEENVITEQPVGRLVPNKKNTGKVPKKEHKAKREKLKRDHLNELFSELGHALEPAKQNNGKASILGDATRLLQDLIARVGSLRKENAALVSESCYVAVEKNELIDENAVLGAEIARLRNELHERMHTNTVWHNGAEVAPPTLPQPTSAVLPVQQPPVGPLYVTPLHQDLHPSSDTGNIPTSKPPSHVRRPHARYPTPSDSWPLELLSRHQRAAHEALHNSTTTTTTTTTILNSREEGTDKADGSI
ncbi:transcription factor BHLH062-like [Phoenix dactylifera]|uniref:Transcription factor BHLH062-like n=1 Tax=Phoenix dactylifera TaxID=42345 RepID=A0A8B7CWG6_PHODC|nr:transcription factor BHLH062-like [Phoenix dactylifera]XP_017701446.1 transcription factor BHLH062-like [Phoenix dactylifera]